MASELLAKIKDDIKTAMKAHDAETLGTLRTLHSDIKNEAMKAGATPAQIEETITDAMCVDVLARSVKQKQEAIDILKEGKINCIVECTPMLGSLLMETALAVKAGQAVDPVIHPVERVFSDYDDLSALEPRGY